MLASAMAGAGAQRRRGRTTVHVGAARSEEELSGSGEGPAVGAALEDVLALEAGEDVPESLVVDAELGADGGSSHRLVAVGE